VRVVYFVASHVHPPQIVRLVHALLRSGPGSRVVLNHDYSVSYLDPAPFAGLDRVAFVEGQRSPGWGTFRQIAMLLNALRWISERDQPDWIVYLTGQCYPIMPLPAIERFLATTPHHGFVGLHRRVDPTRMQDAEDREFVDRYFFAHHPLPQVPWAARVSGTMRGAGARIRLAFNRSQPLLRLRAGALGNPPTIGVRALRPPFSAARPCYKGSPWWTLSARAVRHLLGFVDEHPEYVRHYRHVFAPNESFVHSVLFNAPELDILRDSCRFIRWTGGGSHPDTLRAQDFPALAASGKHFARKVDARVDPALLDLLDAHLATG